MALMELRGFAQLEYWNNGIRGKYPIFNFFGNGFVPLKPLFQHSIIPGAGSQSMLKKQMYLKLVVEIPRRFIFVSSCLCG
jgi:hypothetical protein